MPSIPPAQAYYGDPSYFHGSYRSEAIRSAIFLHLGYFPIYFLAMCVYQNPNIVKRYEEIPTTIFMCTFIRMGTALLNFISFNALTAISISRLLLIIFKINCGLGWNAVFFVLASLPICGDIVYMFFVAKPTENSICGPLLFYYELAPVLLWNGYIFGIPLVAVLLNSITAAYLLYKKYSADAYVKNSRRTVNELFIAAALLLQSVIPALTMSSKGYRSIVEIFGMQTVTWLKELIDTSGHMTTGLNMIASMVCIKHFREMFKLLILRDRTVTRVGEVTTVTGI